MFSICYQLVGFFSILLVMAVSGKSVLNQKDAEIVKQGKEEFIKHFGALVTSNAESIDLKPATEVDFGKFVQKYEKGSEYKTLSLEQQYRRLNNYKVNSIVAQLIQKQEQGTAKYGETKFSDLSIEEFRQTYARSNKRFTKPNRPQQQHVTSIGQQHDVLSTPDNVDWRKKGAVTPVRNQVPNFIRGDQYDPVRQSQDIGEARTLPGENKRQSQDIGQDKCQDSTGLQAPAALAGGDRDPG